MNKEIFRILKEINSIDQKLRVLAKDIVSEQSRYEKVFDILTQKKQELESNKSQHQEIKKNLQTKENDLESNYKLRDNSQEKLGAMTSQKEISSIEQQINHAETQIALLDEELLNLMEKEELHLQEINQLKKYIDGAPQGLLEIQADIDKENQPRKKEIENFNLRKINLLDQLPSSIKEHFEKLINLKLPKSTVTQLDAKNYCAFCGTQIAGPTANEIETKLIYKSCSGCMRVIIPASSLYL